MNLSPLNPDAPRGGGNGRAVQQTRPRSGSHGSRPVPGSRYAGTSQEPSHQDLDPEAPVAAEPLPGDDHGDGHGDGGPGSSRQPPQVSDEALLAAYRVGDKQSFATLVSRYQRELFHFLVRFLGNRAAAEDIFQETFLQVHQSADAFDLQRRFKPWLFTIAANKARDLIRSQARRPANPLQASIAPGDEDGGEFIDLMKAAVPQPDESMNHREMQEKVQRVVGSLPEHLREILILSYFQTFPYRQIADILGIPLGTVKSRLHAAVATFAEKWKAANRSPSES